MPYQRNPNKAAAFVRKSPRNTVQSCRSTIDISPFPGSLGHYRPLYCNPPCSTLTLVVMRLHQLNTQVIQVCNVAWAKHQVEESDERVR